MARKGKYIVCTACGVNVWREHPTRPQIEGRGYCSSACANGNTHSLASFSKAGRAGAKASPWGRGPMASSARASKMWKAR